MPETPADPAGERRLLTHGRARLPGRLDTRWNDEDLPLPPLPELLTLAGDEPVVVWGGEPTLRPDLPALLAGLTRPTLRTDGLALTRAPVVAHLAGVGLHAVRLPLHSGRRDANDWLVGRPGTTRAVVAAARSVVQAGLALELEVTLTRPTASHLDETIELAANLGARAVSLRRLERRGPAASAYVTLSPRLALMEPWLESAVRLGRRRGLRVTLEGLPRCAAPELPADAFAPAPRWLVPQDAAWLTAAQDLSPPADGRCAGCDSSCIGAPADYVALFGRNEFESEGPAGEDRDPVEIAPGVDDPTIPPPPRQGRSPSTRLRAIHQQLARPTLQGDPIAPRGHQPAAVVEVHWRPDESTRDVRVRLVRASQEGADTLRIRAGASLDHPAAAALLREATRLSVPRLELVGDLARLTRLSDDELRRLRRFSAAVAELSGSTPEAHDAARGAGSFAAAGEALTRLHRATRRRVEIAFAAPAGWSGPELPAPLRSEA